MMICPSGRLQNGQKLPSPNHKAIQPFYPHAESMIKDDQKEQAEFVC